MVRNNFLACLEPEKLSNGTFIYSIFNIHNGRKLHRFAFCLTTCTNVE